MAAYESTAGGGGFEMKREKGLDAKNFFLDQSTVGESGSIPEMKSEKGLGANPYAANFFANLAVGVVGAAAAAASTFPLERAHKAGINLSMFATVSRENAAAFNAARARGGPFWRSADIVRYIPMHALSFACKVAYKRTIHLLAGGESENPVANLVVNSAAGGFAGLTALYLVYPLDYARARLGTDVGRAGYMDKGLGDCLIKIAKTEGVGRLYTGRSFFGPCVSIYYASFFGIFDTAKTVYANNNWQMDGLETIFLAWVSARVGELASQKCFTIDMISERHRKQAKLKDVFFKGSLSSAFRSSGAVPLLLIYDFIGSR